MSESIYLRAEARERTIWPAFLYNGPYAVPTENERAIIFGLYAGAYKHGHNYLGDIEAEELQRLVDAHDNNMAELSMKEQSLVLKIAAKRYVFNVDLLIAQENLETKRHKLTAGEEELDTRIAALEADRAELNTLRTRITIAKEVAENEVKKLEAQINLEIVNGEYVDLEIAEKQLAAARAELKVLTTALRGLEIQVAITDTSLRIVEAEASKYQYKADVAGIDARIAGLDLTKDQLSVDQAELEAMEYEIDNLPNKRIELIESQGASTEAEIAGIAIDQAKQLELHTEKLGEMIARLTAQKQVNDNREISAEVRKDILIAGNTLDKALALNDKLSVLREALKRTDIDSAQINAAYTSYRYAIQVAEMLAAADITNILTHTISGA